MNANELEIEYKECMYRVVYFKSSEGLLLSFPDYEICTEFKSSSTSDFMDWLREIDRKFKKRDFSYEIIKAINTDWGKSNEN